ncbi:hypothetical protein MRX96_048720, partial [Rhipicephalus microplus]
YVYNPREAHRRKEQACIAKAIASKVKQEPSDDQKLEAQSTSASLGPNTPALQNPRRLPQSPPPAATPAQAGLRRAPPPPLRRVGTVTTCEPPTTYPLNQLSSLAALSRDGAAVPNGPGLPQFFDASARTMGWFFDQTAQAAAAHMTVGVAAARLHVAPFAEQPEQQRNTATATRRAPTGTAMPNMASRQQRIAGSRWRFTEAATSSTVEATLCSPATVQATQHQDMGGPFQPCELAVSHAITSLPYAYSTQVCCTATGAQPCNALRGPYSGRGGGSILTETPTSFQEAETRGSNRPPP